MSRLFGMGIVGAGMVGDIHARAIGGLPNARLVGVFDQVAPKAREFAGRHGGLAYESLDAMLRDPAIEVVTISTPSGNHMEPTVAAAQHGKHVICEKPLDVSLERIDRMIAAHRGAGTTLGGVFNLRYEPLNRFLKQTVRSGRLGRLVFGGGHVPWYRTQEYYQAGGWRGTWRFDGGGALMNQGTHTVDLLQWLMGERVTRVTAMTALLGHTGLEVEDTAVAVLRFESGALGMLSASTALWPGLPARLELGGSSGYLAADSNGLRVLTCAQPDPGDALAIQTFGSLAPAAGASDPTSIPTENHRRNFADFLQALDQGLEPELSGVEARKAVEIVLAAYQSARTGLPADLPLGNR